MQFFTVDLPQLVMGILLQLGANETAFVQFAIFIFSVSILTIFVYGPFFKAFDERQKQTKGADQVATETQDEAKKIQQIFQAKAREINEKIKFVFDKSRDGATETTQKILNDAKQTSAALVEKARKDIQSEKNSAAQGLQLIVDDVSNEISKKLTGTTL